MVRSFRRRRAASRRNLRRLIDRNRQIAQCFSIDTVTGDCITGKEELFDDRVWHVMLKLRREYYGIYIHRIARVGCLSFFHFLYSVRRIVCVAVYCSKVPAANHYAFFRNGKPARRVMRSSKNFVFIKFLQRASNVGKSEYSEMNESLWHHVGKR